MSTGDQTAYLRSKIAERGTKAAKFMVDGFDEWAASERPARVGGAEKTPCETQMTSRIVGGIRYHGKAVPQGYTPGKEMKGGAIDAQWILSNAQKLYEFYQNALRFTKDVKQDLRSEEVPAKYKKIAGQVADMIERVGFGKAPAEALEECMRDDYKSSGRRGGAADWSSWVKEWSQKLVTFYNWYIANKEGIHYVLNMKSINPEGYDYARQFSGMLKSVGLGRRVIRRGGEMGDIEISEKMETEPLHLAEQKSRQDDSGKYAKYIKMFNQIMSKPDSPAKENWLKENAATVKYLMSKGFIGGVKKTKREMFLEHYGGAKCGCSGGRRRGGDQFTDFFTGSQPAQATMIMNPAQDENESSGVIRALKSSRRAMSRRGGEMEMSEKPQLKFVKSTLIRNGGRAPSARGAIVKRVMAEQGLSLPQASKYVKEHGLY
jgi:hypothetical protein